MATSGHCPGPWVGRDGQVPSQPTAAAGVGPDFSCAGELEQPLKPRIGKMCRPSVGASVARSVARSGLVGLSISRLGVLCLGPSAGLGLWISGDPEIRFWVSPTLLASRLLSSALYVRAYWHDSSVESRLTSRAPVSSSVSPWLARGLQSLLDMAAARCYITRVPPRLAVRCALVSVDGGVGRFSWLD